MANPWPCSSRSRPFRPWQRSCIPSRPPQRSGLYVLQGRPRRPPELECQNLCFVRDTDKRSLLHMRCAPRATTTTSNDRHVRVCYLSRSARAGMYLSNLTAWDGSSSGCCCALRARGVAHAMPHGQRLPPEATTAQSTVNVVRDLKVCALVESERCTSRPASPRTFGETALCVRRACSVCSAPGFGVLGMRTCYVQRHSGCISHRRTARHNIRGQSRT